MCFQQVATDQSTIAWDHMVRNIGIGDQVLEEEPVDWAQEKQKFVSFRMLLCNNEAMHLHVCPHRSCAAAMCTRLGFMTTLVSSLIWHLANVHNNREHQSRKRCWLAEKQNCSVQ